MFSEEQWGAPLGKALIFHGLPLCPLLPLAEETAEHRGPWRSDAQAHHCVTVWSPLVTLCSPQGRWEGDQHLLLFPQKISSSPVRSIQAAGFFALNGLSVHVYQLWCLCATKRGNGKMRNLTSILQNQKENKFASKILPCPICYKQSLFCDQGTAGQYLWTTKFPFVNRKVVWDILSLQGWRYFQAQISHHHSFLNSKMKAQ